MNNRLSYLRNRLFKVISIPQIAKKILKNI